MPADARFTVILAASAQRERERLMRLLTGPCSVIALRTDATGTAAAVRTRRPDVLVTDSDCAAEMVGVLGHDVPPATWIVLVDDDGPAHPLRAGLVPVGSCPSDRQLLAAVGVAGRFARLARADAPAPVRARFSPVGRRTAVLAVPS